MSTSSGDIAATVDSARSDFDRYARGASPSASSRPSPAHRQIDDRRTRRFDAEEKVDAVERELGREPKRER